MFSDARTASFQQSSQLHNKSVTCCAQRFHHSVFDCLMSCVSIVDIVGKLPEPARSSPRSQLPETLSEAPWDSAHTPGWWTRDLGQQHDWNLPLINTGDTTGNKLLLFILLLLSDFEDAWRLLLKTAKLQCVIIHTVGTSYLFVHITA